MPAPLRFVAWLSLVVALAALPFASRAGVPDPAQSTVQNVLVGSWDGHSNPTAVSPCGATHGESFLVIVRDATGAPVPGAFVKIPLAGTGLAVTALQNSGVTIDCAGHTLGVAADANGVVKFTPHFGGYVSTPTVPVFANTVLLGNVTAASADYNADGKISITDLSTFAADYLAVVEPARSDFDNCPANRLSDLTFFAAQYLASHGTQLAPICP